MAVTGVFQADFSNFDKAVKQSEAALGGLEAAGGRTASSLRLMADSQEKMLNQIGAAGGRIQDLNTTVTATSSTMAGLSASYLSVNNAMKAVGLSVGPQVAGLLEIGTAASAGAASLGVLGTAGAIFTAAVTGWKIGGIISDFLGLDAAIQQVGESLGLIGSVAGETAGAKLDTINKALEMGAKQGISYAGAIKFIAEETKKTTDANINWREKLADAHREVRNLTEAQKIEIAIAVEAGAKTEQLTNKYGVHAKALEILAQGQKDAAAATAEHARESAKLAAAKEAEAAALDKAYQKLMSETKNANQLALMNADAAKMEADAFNAKQSAGAGWMRQVNDFVKKQEEAAGAGAALQKSNAALIDSFQLTGDAAYIAALKMAPGSAADKAADQAVIDAWMKAGEAVEAATVANDAHAESAWHVDAAYQGVAASVELSKDAIEGWIELMQYTNASNALLNQNSLFTTTSTLENQARLGGAFSPIPGFAGGIENFAGGLAKVHGGEVLANLPPGTSVFPRGQGLGATVNNTFNLVDSESNLARRVAELIMRQVRAGTQLGTA